MTLDSAYVSSREAIARGKEADHARDLADWQEDQAIYEYETSGAAWQAKHDRQHAEQPAFHYPDRPGVDRRLHDRAAAVADGELRDVDPEDVAS